MKIGIALGGGGARGFAHLGVLRIFEKKGIPINYIAGTSMGAMIGACYALNPNIDEVESHIREVLSKPIISKLRIDALKENEDKEQNILKKAQNFFRDTYLLYLENTQYSYIELKYLEDIINLLLPDIPIEETSIPFCCVATDLTYGRAKIFTKGSLRESVLASSSIPGVFPPVNIGGIYYNDGAAVSVTPVNAVRQLGADFVIASNVKSKIIKWNKPENAREIIARSNFITGILFNEMQLREAQVVISPDVGYFHWTDFDKINLMIKKGEQAAMQKINEIKIKQIGSKFKDWLKMLFR